MSSINELKSIIGGGGGVSWSGSANGNNFFENGSAFTFDIPVDSSTKVVDICIRIHSSASSGSPFGGYNIKLNDSYLARSSSSLRISTWNGTNIFKVYGLVNNGTLSAIVEVESPMDNDAKNKYSIVEGAISIPISNNKIIFYALGTEYVSNDNNGTIMAYTL